MIVAFIVGLASAIATADAGLVSPAWLVIPVLFAFVAWEVLGVVPASSRSPTASVPTIELGAGWSLVGASSLAPIYIEALTAWAWITDRWEPVWRSKRGGRKAGRRDALRLKNARGTVSRLLSVWLKARASSWSHSQLTGAMFELGLLYRYRAGETFGTSVVPLPAVNERLRLRIGATLEQDRRAHAP